MHGRRRGASRPQPGPTGPVSVAAASEEVVESHAVAWPLMLDMHALARRRAARASAARRSRSAPAPSCCGGRAIGGFAELLVVGRHRRSSHRRSAASCSPGSPIASASRSAWRRGRWRAGSIDRTRLGGAAARRRRRAGRRHRRASAHQRRRRRPRAGLHAALSRRRADLRRPASRAASRCASTARLMITPSVKLDNQHRLRAGGHRSAVRGSRLLPVTTSSPRELEIWNHRLAQVAEEMGVALARAAFSPNIKERRDYSCALFDARGRLVAQAAHIPVHLGSTALSVRAVLERLTLADGEVAIVNDPFAGGTHLPDVTLVRPVFVGGRRARRLRRQSRPSRRRRRQRARLDAGRRTRARRRAARGRRSCRRRCRRATRRRRPVADRRAPVTIDDEGLRIPPTRLDDDVVGKLCAVARAPDERRGDLAAQRAALEVGCRRAAGAGGGACGAETLAARAQALIDYSDALLRAAIADIPDGVYAFADSLDDDGAGRTDVGIRVSVTIVGDRAVVDFSDSDEEVRGPLNAVYAVTLSAVLYAFRLLAARGRADQRGPDRAARGDRARGLRRSMRAPPRAVAAGNVETSQRVVDVVLGALAQALPARFRRRARHDVEPARRRRRSAPTTRPSAAARARRPTAAGASAHPDAHDQHAQHADRGAGAALPVRVRALRACVAARAAAARTPAATASCASSSCSRQRR